MFIIGNDFYFKRAYANLLWNKPDFSAHAFSLGESAQVNGGGFKHPQAGSAGFHSLRINYLIRVYFELLVNASYRKLAVAVLCFTVVQYAEIECVGRVHH